MGYDYCDKNIKDCRNYQRLKFNYEAELQAHKYWHKAFCIAMAIVGYETATLIGLWLSMAK